ncbi:SRPBCC family protein [Polluticaenibacter yanchengensis]|uniref:SRPBCC family protein n=1 Tax=Polluticaenibacter yanchengensis TaxID=3014562 RepID=A0ABT4UP82_9BACT|nr:SRPBCC family protein [Chitinophagaceae bacterium LY-5]
MRIIKTLLIAIISIIALILIVALFLPKTFSGEGVVIINKPVNEVFSYVKQIKNQENYGVWFKMDNNITKEYSGEDGTVGFKYSWKSKKVGDGEQVITKIEENKRIEMDLFFNGEKEPAKSYISTEPVDSTQTKVTWAVSGSIPYPFNIMCLFYDMNKDFKEGVQNLKTVLEKQ